MNPTLFFILLLSMITLAEAKVFTIKEGEHFSFPDVIKYFQDDRMDLTVTFNESARYEFEEAFKEDQQDTNKLYGFSDCSDNHMQNSARLGWMWYLGQLRIMAFTHFNGEKRPKFITTAPLNKALSGSIQISSDGSKYIYTFEGKTVEDDRGCRTKKAKGYHLRPYFGGNQKAPHEIKIKVNLKDDFGPVMVQRPYPNPSNGRFSFKVRPTENVDFYIQVFDISGRLVHKSSPAKLVSNREEILTYDLHRRYAAGAYIIKPIVVFDDGTELLAATPADSPNSLIILFQ